jgi:hypothetical protein
LCKVQTVNYERLALGFDRKVEKDSNLRRIQRFFASYILDHDLIAKLVFKLLPKQEKYELTMVYVVEFGYKLAFSKSDNEFLVND